jgi:hypothetical protein
VGLAMEGAGIFYGHLVYFVAIWYILWLFGIFCGHLVYFVANWYILWLFGIHSPVLVFCTKKNLATLMYAPDLPVNACKTIRPQNLDYKF